MFNRRLALSAATMLVLGACSGATISGVASQKGNTDSAGWAGDGGLGDAGTAETPVDGKPLSCPAYSGTISSTDLGYCSDYGFQGRDGGPGTVCNSSLQENRYIYGTGFDAHEGQRVIGLHGEAIVVNGAFQLFVGYFGGCDPQQVVYRFDVVPGDGCGPGDEAFSATMTEFANVTAAEPGTKATCDVFPSGLGLSLTTLCFPICGTLSAGLFDGDTLLASNSFRLDNHEDNPIEGQGSFDGATLSALLVVGKNYRVDYAMKSSCFDGMTPFGWSTSFTAKPGRNVVSLDARSPFRPTVCSY